MRLEYILKIIGRLGRNSPKRKQELGNLHIRMLSGTLNLHNSEPNSWKLYRRGRRLRKSFRSRQRRRFKG